MQQDPNNHTLLSQISSFFRAYLIPPTFSTTSNRAEMNREFIDNHSLSTENEDITYDELCQKSLDQNHISKHNSNGVQELDLKEEDTISYMFQFKQKKR